MSTVSTGPKRDNIATESRGISWIDSITHHPLVARFLQQAGCIEQVWAISSEKDGSQSYGAMTTYVDGQDISENRQPNLLSFPHWLKLRHPDTYVGPDQTSLTSEEESKILFA